MKTQYTFLVTIGLFSAGMVYALPSPAVAQATSPPSYQADPDVYKVIFEDQNFRVIKSTRKKGVHDKPIHIRLLR